MIEVLKCRSLGCEDLYANGESLIWMDDEKPEWFPYCKECLAIFERAGDAVRRWGVDIPVATREWRVNSPQLGVWPELFWSRVHAEGDLRHCRETYPDHEFWIESREVAEWTRDES